MGVGEAKTGLFASPFLHFHIAFLPQHSAFQLLMISENSLKNWLRSVSVKLKSYRVFSSLFLIGPKALADTRGRGYLVTFPVMIIESQNSVWVGRDV